MMASVDDKLAILNQYVDEESKKKKSSVLYFRPDKLIKEKQNSTIVLTKDNFQTLTGVPEGHDVIGMCAYLQKTDEKTEIVTFSEDLDEK